MSTLDSSGKELDKPEMKQALIDVKETNTSKVRKELDKPEMKQALIEVKETNTSKKESLRSVNSNQHPNNTDNNNKLGIEDYAKLVWNQFKEKIWNKVDDENKICCVCSSTCCFFIFFFLFYSLFIQG